VTGTTGGGIYHRPHFWAGGGSAAGRRSRRAGRAGPASVVAPGRRSASSNRPAAD